MPPVAKNLLENYPDLIPVFKEETNKLLLERIRLTCYLAFSLNFIFYGLDWIIYPQFALTFFWIRVCMSLLVVLALSISFTSPGKKYVHLLAFTPFVIMGWGIVAMCILAGGHKSIYYAGLNLVMLGYSVLMPWPLRDAVITTILLYGAYLLNIFIFDHITDYPLFISNNCFLLSTAVIANAATFSWDTFRQIQFLDRQKLRKLDRAKSNFLATISHELKTPLTLIIYPLEQALLEGDGEKASLQPDQIRIVRRNVYRLSSLINDLIEVARSEVGKPQLAVSDIIDVRKYCEEIFYSMTPLFKEKNITYHLEIRGDLKPVSFDIKKMDKVFYNLLSNAHKFTPQGGKITMSIWDEDSTFRCKVSDTGIGIPKEKIQHIFERFMQVEEGLTRSFEGMGVGLSLVKDFTEQHGGQVTVTSELGQGTTFELSLPRGKEHFRVPVVDSGKQLSKKRTPEEMPTPILRKSLPQQTTAKLDLSKSTLLIVDDNAEVRESLKQCLEADYNVLLAKNGEEGLQKASHFKPALIISDIMMPIMNGIQMIQEIHKKKELQEIPVIFITARSDTEGLEEAYKAGASDYLHKPFSPQELKIRVKNLINMKDSLHKAQNSSTSDFLQAS